MCDGPNAGSDVASRTEVGHPAHSHERLLQAPVLEAHACERLQNNENWWVGDKTEKPAVNENDQTNRLKILTCEIVHVTCIVTARLTFSCARD